ncbi:MAG: leucyl/phenylalanyl-tRNA--protein transferase [Chitinophagales bacterium]|nr:leucyl/phenylalanyl-tRNA--protein transferase [Chitinophagales bacterium]MBX7224963.1 leucyl/phenylalanyl-tRNA--protein transferase [Chitinophagales bacterium]
MKIPIIGKTYTFPNPENAYEGVVAIGGDLSPHRLLNAYKNGIFPWFSEDEPIIWWCPDPRFVLFPKDLIISKSMKKLFEKKTFEITTNHCFAQVIQACAQQKRPEQDGTWITQEMTDAYLQLHKLGYAHSVEVWQDKQLVGGLYGVIIGKAFFGESMFFKVSNASKYGFIWLVKQLQEQGFHFIDCQIETNHLKSLGASHIPRKEFLQLVKLAVRSD